MNGGRLGVRNERKRGCRSCGRWGVRSGEVLMLNGGGELGVDVVS